MGSPAVAPSVTPAGPPRRPPPDGGDAPRLENVERRAGFLLLFLLALLIASVVYLLFARGVFEPTQRVVLIADDSEGVVVGMDVTFSGFPIGRVRRIELGTDGRARILLDIPRKDAHWLRSTSVFTLTRGLVGNTALRAFSGQLSDPPLPDGAERVVLAGDAAAEIPKLMSAVRDLVANLTALTAADGALAGTLDNTRRVTQALSGPDGALGLLMGNPQDRQKVLATLTRTQQLLARLEGLTGRTDAMLGRADAQIFGPQGLTQDTKAALQQAQGLLADARQSLQRVDALLAEAHGTARQVRGATADLDVLRAEVDASLRKLDGLVNDINRLWPFKRDAEIKLP